jgi:hypothetical protein
MRHERIPLREIELLYWNFSPYLKAYCRTR